MRVVVVLVERVVVVPVERVVVAPDPPVTLPLPYSDPGVRLAMVEAKNPMMVTPEKPQQPPQLPLQQRRRLILCPQRANLYT